MFLRGFYAVVAAAMFAIQARRAERLAAASRNSTSPSRALRLTARSKRAQTLARLWDEQARMG